MLVREADFINALERKNKGDLSGFEYYLNCYRSEINTLQKYDIIEFGNYIIPHADLVPRQTQIYIPIFWQVLEKIKTKLLLISKYCLFFEGYEESGLFGSHAPTITWENSTIRETLNNKFFNQVFNENEKNVILTTNVSTNNNLIYKTLGGNGTQDKLFLLSVEEVIKYYSPPSITNSKNSFEYKIKEINGWLNLGSNLAKAEIIYIDDFEKIVLELEDSYWWSRTPGEKQNTVACIDCYGEKIHIEGVDASRPMIGVRPAMWIDTEFL